MTTDASKRRPEAGEGTPARLLRAAEWLIIHEGVHALTIRRVAAVAASNSALVGYHFGGIDGMLAELARLNSEAILGDRRALLAGALEAGGTADALLQAFLRPLWREAAHSPGERAMIVVDEILSRAELALREEVWGWFSASAVAFLAAFGPVLPHLDPPTLRWRLRFLAAAALDMPPRFSRSVLAPLEADLVSPGDEERYRQFFAFARDAMGAAPG